MLLRPAMTPREKLNFVRRIPSTQVLTPAEEGMYTGIFSSRGYDTKHAYDWYRKDVFGQRSGYLRGVGGEMEAWNRPGRGLGADDPCAGMSWWEKYLTPRCDDARLRAANVSGDTTADEVRAAMSGESATVDCSGLRGPNAIDDCIRLIEAARGRVSINTIERDKTSTRDGPATGAAWAGAIKWAAIAGAFGVGAYALYSILGRKR